MENPEAAQGFEEVGNLLDIQGENSLRVRGYQNATHTIRDLSALPARMPPEKVVDLDGIGKDDSDHSPHRRPAPPPGLAQAILGGGRGT